MNDAFLRILIVEDEFLIADLVSDMVEMAGHTVFGMAPSGERAVEMLDPNGIDLAILDIKLQGVMTGIDVAVEARRRGIPHLFISGSGDPKTRLSADRTEPVAFLQKPFSEKQLISLLATVVKRSTQRPELNPKMAE